MATSRRYQSHDEDSARWLGFPFRDDDIVISTRSKTGTTWVQMICALLIFQQPRLPAPIAQLSPWLDHLIAPRQQVFAQLAAQEHRRFNKTHTPLDGVPLDARVTYLVTARHPLDVAVLFRFPAAPIQRGARFIADIWSGSSRYGASGGAGAVQRRYRPGWQLHAGPRAGALRPAR